MAQIKFTIGVETKTDGQVTLVAGPADVIKLERHFNTSLGESQRIEHVCFLAWSALRRRREGVPDFDAWVDQELESIEVETGKEAAGNDQAEPPA